MMRTDRERRADEFLDEQLAAMDAGGDVSFKDDPLQQSRRGRRTLWLDRENNTEARENYWQAFQALLYDSSAPFGAAYMPGQGADRRTWDIAWAAAIAAFDYMMQGKLEP